MLKVRWYKVFNDLFGNMTRTVLIVLSMSVGLFAIGIILSARSILSAGLARSFAAIHPSSGTIRTVEPFDEAFLESVRSMPDIAQADARRVISARVEVAPGEWKNLTLFVIADYDEIRVNKVSSDFGAWPPPEREILIERSAWGLVRAQVGGWLRIRLTDDHERLMRVAGQAHDPAQVPAQLDSTPYGYIAMETLDWLGESRGYNELQVITTRPQDKDWSQQVINRVKDKAERSGYTIPMSMTLEPGQLPMNDILQGILLLMGILGLMSLFLSVFLVVNTVMAMLAQQRRQIGVMKAVGGGSGQILGMYLVMVLCYGVLALLLSIPAGIQGARALSAALAVYFNFSLPSMDIPPLAIVLQVIIGLLLPVLASILPFVISLRVSPAEAISSYSAGRGRPGGSRVDRLISGARLWFTRDWPLRQGLLSLRNTFRNPGRLALTLSTLTLASAAFVSVFTVRASLSQTVLDMVSWFNGDAMMTFDRSQRAARVQLEALSVPGVVETDVWLQFPARMLRNDGTESGLIYLFAPRIGESSLIQSPAIAEGRWLEPEDDHAVVVPTAFLKDEPELRLGGEIVLKIDGEEHPFKIVGTYLGTSFAAFMYANYDYIAGITDRVGEADALMITTLDHDQAGVERQAGLVEDHFDSIGIGVNLVSTIQSETADAEVVFDSVTALLLVMSVLLALVGGLGLMGTMSINVLERTREIGVLRAIGASNRSVAQVFILEGILIGLLSWAMGAVLAVPMSRGLVQALGESMMGMALSWTYSMPGLWTWLAAVILLSALASYIPARNASRLTVREVLAYE